MSVEDKIKAMSFKPGDVLVIPVPSSWNVTAVCEFATEVQAFIDDLNLGVHVMVIPETKTEVQVVCGNCGIIKVQDGSSWKCLNCGQTSSVS
jgi:hypothetical protein